MGPNAAVLLPRTLTATDDARIEALLRRASCTSHDTIFNFDDFQVRETWPQSGYEFDASRPFSATRVINPECEPERQQQILNCFGFTPSSEVWINAFCNSDIDHRILANLCILFAETFDGVIDLNGAIIPRTVVHSYNPPTDWSAVEAQTAEYFSAFPGRLLVIPYEVTPYRNWASHVADPTFLRAWQQHPDFSMIK
jgi:Family of unknown function (DUF6368)